MASNDFLVFAGAGGANVVTQSTYASMAALGPGFQTGIAESNQLNKVWRQGSIIASVVGQLIADVTGQNAIDDGTNLTLLGNLLTALQAVSFQADQSGAANAYSLVFSPAPVNALFDGAVYSFRPNHTNTTASTLSVNGSPAHAIVDQQHNALIGSEIVANSIVTVVYDATASAFVLESNGGGFQHGPTASPGDNSTRLATTAFVQAAAPTVIGAQVIALVNSSGGILHQAGPNTIGVTHAGTGMYTITFGTAMPSGNYVVNVTANNSAAYAANWSAAGTGSFHVTVFNSASGTPTDIGFGLSVFY